jgi:WD40 repeat protein
MKNDSYLSEGQYIVAGSDDGKYFCWEKKTGNIVRVLKGDEAIVNCLQSHPTSCVLATSGIDPVVRIWAPLPQVCFRFLYFNISYFLLIHQGNSV